MFTSLLLGELVFLGWLPTILVVSRMKKKVLKMFFDFWLIIACNRKWYTAEFGGGGGRVSVSPGGRWRWGGS